VPDPIVPDHLITHYNHGERLVSPNIVSRKQLPYLIATRAPHVERRNDVGIDKDHSQRRNQSRPHAIAASISSVVGLNPPRSFTGFGTFARRVLPAAMPLRMNSAIASLSFLCSCTARIFTARISSSGRSSVVFITQPYSQKAGFLSNSCRPSLRLLFA